MCLIRYISLFTIVVLSSFSMGSFAANAVNASCFSQGNWSPAQGGGFTSEYRCATLVCSCGGIEGHSDCVMGSGNVIGANVASCSAAYMQSLGWTSADIANQLPAYYAGKSAVCAQAPANWKIAGNTGSCQDNEVFTCSGNNNGGVMLTYSGGTYNACNTNSGDSLSKQCMMCRSQMLGNKYKGGGAPPAGFSGGGGS